VEPELEPAGASAPEPDELAAPPAPPLDPQAANATTAAEAVAANSKAVDKRMTIECRAAADRGSGKREDGCFARC
jgi:hypothetical protein